MEVNELDTLAKKVHTKLYLVQGLGVWSISELPPDPSNPYYHHVFSLEEGLMYRVTPRFHAGLWAQSSISFATHNQNAHLAVVGARFEYSHAITSKWNLHLALSPYWSSVYQRQVHDFTIPDTNEIIVTEYKQGSLRLSLGTRIKLNRKRDRFMDIYYAPEITHNAPLGHQQRPEPFNSRFSFYLFRFTFEFKK